MNRRARFRLATPRALGLALALTVIAQQSTARADEVAWRSVELPAVLTEAVAQHRLVLVDFYAVWCGPCQTMDMTVWNRADVATAAGEGYVALRVDSDTPAGIALRRQYNIGALPTVLALHADGTEIDRLVGGADAPTVIAALGAWRRGQSTLDVLSARLQQRPDDLPLRLDVGTRYADRGDETHALAALNEVLQRDPQNAAGLASQAALSLGDRLFLRALHDPTRAVAPLENLLARWPGSDAAAHAFVPLATAYHRTARDPQARVLLARYLDSAPPGTLVGRANSAAWMMFREHWDLPAAEAIARRGIPGAPQDDSLAALLDTLAEIVFAQGRVDEAVRCEQRAARLDPASAYYRQQIQRFQAGTAADTPSARHVRPAGTTG